jgi:putative inorganic carbon (hco3(-)) transporter
MQSTVRNEYVANAPSRQRGGSEMPFDGPLFFLAVVVGLLLPGVLAYSLVLENEFRVLAVVVAVATLLLVLARPFWGLLLFVAVLYTRPEEMYPVLAGLRLSLMVAVVALIALLLQIFINRERMIRTPLMAMMTGFVFWGIICAIRPALTGQAFQDLVKLLVLVFLIINLVRTPERFQAMMTTIILFTTYLAAYSIHLYYSGGAMDYQDMERSMATGIFSDPNDLAAAIVAGLALIAVRAWRGRGARRIGYLALGIVCLNAILLTNSRGATVALLVSMGAGFFIFSRKKTVALATAAFLGAVLMVAGPARMTSFDSTETSANMRFGFWQQGIYWLMDNPLTGIGYNQFDVNNGGYTAHNSFVLCFGELGLPGYFFWIGCLYFCFRRRPAHLPKIPDEPDPRTGMSAQDNHLAARLALAAFLTAVFWISRTYVPILYVLIGLPAAAELALAPAAAEELFAKTNWKLDLKCIVLACVGSILLIKGMILYFG